jgi:DNA-directed RNA polymerase subunit RPC12/RpoP
MTFKAAKCPNCGGALQLPDDRTKVKCMYCGVDVIVREAVQLAAGRVKASTPAQPVQSMEEIAHAAEGTPKVMTIIFIGFGVLVLLVTLIGMVKPKRDSEATDFPILCSGPLILFALILIAIGWPRPAKSAQYREVQSGWRGECPYCSTAVSLSLGLGADCPACHKRIVIRDEMFYSVDTPVSGLRVGGTE